MVFYPSMPYAHKYANAVAEKGIFGALKDVILADSTAGNIVSMVAKGGMSLFERDMLKVMEILVDMEMRIFQGPQREGNFSADHCGRPSFRSRG